MQIRLHSEILGLYIVPFWRLPFNLSPLAIKEKNVSIGGWGYIQRVKHHCTVASDQFIPSMETPCCCCSGTAAWQPQQVSPFWDLTGQPAGPPYGTWAPTARFSMQTATTVIRVMTRSTSSLTPWGLTFFGLRLTPLQILKHDTLG